MSLFNSIKTNNPLIDAIITTVLLTIMGIVANNLYELDINNLISLNNIPWMRKNIIILEGNRCCMVSSYQDKTIINSAFGDRFKAVWGYIINDIENNSSIFEVTENVNDYNKSNEKKGNTFHNDMFIVSQTKPFLIHPYIYAKTEIKHEYHEQKGLEKNNAKMNKIIIQIFSYKLSVSELKTFVDDITQRYLENIEDSRFNKKFIYTLQNTKFEESKFECWSEVFYDSTRTFDNFFFRQKEMVMKKIQFFMDNKEWYSKMGIPYTLGISAYGPPGTGKTTLIKCIANMTGRHIVELSLKLIKTKKQLYDFFFEDQYNSDNKKYSIGFDKKIIVIEDIDCLGDIVLKRTEKHATTKKTNTNNMHSILEKIANKVDDADKNIVMLPNIVQDEPITLDDLLNMLDGVRETSGRIWFISSNHYDRLDPALIRPGRIDITLELNYVDHDIIRQMFQHFYNIPINEQKLKKIREHFYTPAEIVNVFMTNNDDPHAFIIRLMKNKHI